MKMSTNVEAGGAQDERRKSLTLQHWLIVVNLLKIIRIVARRAGRCFSMKSEIFRPEA